MKKVLLATTILGMTAGFAAAEIAFTGEATAGYGHAETDSDVQSGTYTSFTLSVAATKETDSGLSFGASFDVSTGKTFDFDGEDSSFDNTDVSDDENGIGAPTVFISGDFGKVAFAVDGFADYSNDDNDFHDIEYTHSISGFSIGLRGDLDGADADPSGVASDGENNGEYSVKLGYAVEGITLGYNYDSLLETYDASASYAAGDLTFGLGYNDDEVTSVSVKYSANGISAGIEADSDEVVTLSAGYEANGLTIGVETTTEPGVDDSYTATAGYDLGGGLALEAGYHDSQSAFVGAKMSF